MSIRLNNKSSSSRTQISQTPRPSCSKLESQQLSSKSGTHSGSRTRSHEPKPRPSTHMESPTPTTTPRKQRKHNKGSQRPDQREQVPALQPDNEDDQDAISDEELMDLLGMTGSDLAKRGGILAISLADIAEIQKGRRGGRKAMVGEDVGLEPSQADRKTPRKRGAKKAHTVEKGFEVTEPIAGTAGRSAGTPNRKGKGSTKQPVLEASGPTSTLDAPWSGRSTAKLDDSDLAHFDIDSSPYDLAVLSRSLPHQQYQMPCAPESEAGESIGERRSEAWDSPGKVATETPNWQQELHSRSPEVRKTSRGSERKPRKAPSAFQPSTLNPSRPKHDRRASTDGLPTRSLPQPPKSAPPLAPSAFDQDGSYHIGFNVNRAPQTPSKGNLRETLSTTPLPVIQGGFPRINKVFDNVLNAHPQVQQSQSAPNSELKGATYAGPISHHSPHARTLSKPELDEF